MNDVANPSLLFAETVSYVALHVAARRHRVEACVALLQDEVAAVGGTRSRMTSLDAALSSGHTGWLLQVVNTAEATDGQRRMCSEALRYAICANKPEAFRELVARGADVGNEIPGEKPYLLAAELRSADRAIEELLRAGAIVEVRLWGHSPLHFAYIYIIPSMARTASAQLGRGRDRY